MNKDYYDNANNINTQSKYYMNGSKMEVTMRMMYEWRKTEDTSKKLDTSLYFQDFKIQR